MPGASPLMISAGASPGSTFPYTITIVSEGIVEEDEEFSISLPDQSAVTYTIGMMSNVTITITNDDSM